MRPFQGQSLAYGFASGVFGCKATGNGDEDLGATTICPDAPMTSNGPVIDWMAPQVSDLMRFLGYPRIVLTHSFEQFPGDRGAY
jgi:hypothetical protein